MTFIVATLLSGLAILVAAIVALLVQRTRRKDAEDADHYIAADERLRVAMPRQSGRFQRR